MAREYKRPFYQCDECCGHNEPYMVHKPLWASVGLTPTDRVCIPCLEQKLGRSLEIGDFTDSGINLPVFYGAYMVTRSPLIKQHIEKIREQLAHLRGGEPRALFQFRDRKPMEEP